jgi:SWI/SNF-related matrix-associated actin-dependent regulator 1 of chromatin subfamily A
MLKLRDYQEKAVEAMLSRPWGRPHFLLADDIGTGKTISTIEAAKRAGCTNGIILCPLAIKDQWKRQMITWELAAEDEIQVASGRDYQLTSAPWVILNYDLIRESEIRNQLNAKAWHCLVLDEAHRLKTHNSQQTHAVFHRTAGIGNRCYWKWALSGSIMPNRPMELYPLLKTMAPEVIQPYDNWPAFIQRYCGGAFSAGKGASNIDELTERLQPFMLRRMLKDVWREMPEVQENEVYIDVPFTDHPEWIGGDFMPESTMRRIVAEAKIPYTAEYVRQRLDDGLDKVVVVTYHRAVTEGLAKLLSKYGAVKIYGGISPKLRDENLAKFQQDPHCKALLLQIMSAGEGLDGLQHVASEYILSEPEWSPGRENQVGGRLLRLGQTKTVIKTSLIAADSYEDVIRHANKRKRKVIDKVTKPNGGSFMAQHFEESLASIAADIKELKAALIKGVEAGVQNFQAATPKIAAPAPTIATAPVAPAPVAPAAPPAVVAAPIAAPIAPVVASAPEGFGVFPTQKAFEQHVIDTFKPFGDPGIFKVKELCNTFGVGRLGEINAQNVPLFLQHMQAAVAQLQAA